MKAPSVKQTILDALESGKVLTHGLANEITMSTEGGRTIRQLRQDGYPIEERIRPNKLRKGSVKEFFYSEKTIAEIKEARMKQGELFKDESHA